jgi:hypothetical protein
VCAVAVALAVGVSGCGGSGSPSPTRSVTSATRSGTSATRTSTSTSTSTTTGSHRAGSPHRPHRRRRTVSGPPVGARQEVHTGGSDLTVTILRVLSLGETGSPVLPGTRQVGVELRIANQAGATYDSTSSGDVSLVLSHGAGTPLDVRRGPCETMLVDFESIVSAGSVRSGCVAFSVPRGARVTGVRFSPDSRPPGTLTWRVSS